MTFLQREFFDAGLLFTAVMGFLNALLMVWQVKGPYRLRSVAAPLECDYTQG